MSNRLANETSPYLLQHKDNPVDWMPWGDEAFTRAKEENRPVFLSVGYSSCHWCHVMAHESFEDQQVADILNRDFVNVKVDREERPDVDEAYMTAVQLSSGRGGWPMSVFLTPERNPFFAGTYFPKEDRGGHPGFTTVVKQIAAAWKDRKADLHAAADEFARALTEARATKAPATLAKLDEEFLANAVRALAHDFDNKNAGFGAAPKFPPHTSIEFLLNFAVRPTATEELREAAVTMAFSTLEAMALGGMRDHVGGGFHRYSTDDHWLLPHFEKMLYDNALMLANYSRAAMMCKGVDEELERLFQGAAADTAAWLLREMSSPEGLFYSALDADSEGEEGKFYVWTVQEVRELLGDQGPAFLKAFNFLEHGNFADEATGEPTGANIPYRMDAKGQEFEEELAALHAAREKRVRPQLDDKALVSWNGLAIAALAESGMIAQAGKAALEILAIEKREGKLPHQIAKGRASGEAFLEDYAYLIDALVSLALYQEVLEANREMLEAGGFEIDPQVTSAPWKKEAERLTAVMVAKFYDEEGGGFYGTAAGHEDLFGRSKPVFDQPQPSGNGIAIRCLFETGDLERGRASIQAMLGWMERAPQATEALYVAALSMLRDDAPKGVLEVPAAPAAEPAPKMPVADVKFSLTAKELVANPHGWASGEILVSVPEGLHLNTSSPPARWLTATAVTIQPLKSTIDYPPGDNDRYHGEVRIPFMVELPHGENGAEFEVRVAYQACTESECLLPAEKVLNGVAVR